MKSQRGPAARGTEQSCELLERFEPLSRAAAHFHVSGISETWKFGLIGSETVTLFRFRPPDQVHHRHSSQRASTRSSKGYRSVFRAGERLELLER
jgi:hypothetical protein